MKNTKSVFTLSLFIIITLLVSVTSISFAAAKEVWTCPMHSKIIKEQPGKCPICSMKLVKITLKKSNTIKSFVKEQKTFIKLAMELSDAFTNDAFEAVTDKAEEVKAALLKIDTSSLKGSELETWKKIVAELKGGLMHIGMSKGFKMARVGLQHFSGGLEKLLKQFGQATKRPVEKMFCPMANGSKGAIWFQYGKKVKNPYYGKAMLSCGSSKAVFNTKSH